MKSNVFVLVHRSEVRGRIVAVAEASLNRHRRTGDAREGQFEYLVGPFDASFSDPVAEAQLPEKDQPAFVGHIARVEAVPPEADAGSVVTPDGVWHDASDFGWRMMAVRRDKERSWRQWHAHVRGLLAAHPDCFVLEYWVYV